MLHRLRKTKSRARGHPALQCGDSARALTGTGHTYAEETAPGWELTAHILLSMGAAALLFAAAVTAVLLVFLDRRLRTRRIADLPKVLPPLDALEKVMFRLIGGGFVLLTLALLTGFIFVTNLFAQHLHTQDDPVAHRVGDLRRAADRPHPLRLARALRDALDLERFRLSGPVVFRFEIRARVPARTTLGLTAETNAHISPSVLLFCGLGMLLILAAFFAGSETALMSLNRYRLRHRAKAGNRGARLAENLLAHPDRLIGLILLLSTIVNVAAPMLVGFIALRLGGEFSGRLRRGWSLR